MASRTELNKLLAEIIKIQARQPASLNQAPISQMILSPAPNVKPYATDSSIGEDPRGPSNVNRFFDLLSRPLYGVANVAKETISDIKEGDSTIPEAIQTGLRMSPLGLTFSPTAWRGYSGKDKTTGNEVINELFGERKRTIGAPPIGEAVGRAAGSFALDVGLDPLTYTGFGLAPKLGKSAKTSISALGQVEEGSQLAAKDLLEDISRRAAQQSDILNNQVNIPTGREPVPQPSIPSRGQVQDPPRIFQAGPGAGIPQLGVPQLPPGSQKATSTVLPGQSVAPLDTNAISFIKQSLSKGVPLEKAALRPLTDIEKDILEKGVAEGKSSRALEKEISSATGVEPQKVFELPTQPRQVTPEDENVIQQLELQREELVARIDDLEGQPSSVGLNQEISRLEGEVRKIGGEIAAVKKGGNPPSETISTPVANPRSAKDLIEEVSRVGVNWRRMTERQLRHIPEGADRVSVVRHLEALKSIQRSPVFRNMIDVQIRKLKEGITPANLIDAAKTNVPDFPPVQLSKARQQNAESIAKNFVKTNKYTEINPVGQSNLFNRIQTWAIKNVPEAARGSVMLNMLRTAEDYILAQGRKLVDAEGISVRLSDIANIAGGSKTLTPRLVDDFRKARPNQAVEIAKAANAPKVATEILDPAIQVAKKTADALPENLPRSRTALIGSELGRELSKLAQNAGASAKEAKTAKEFIGELFNPNKDQLYSDVMKEARALMRQTMTGKVDAHLTNRINKSVYDSLSANPKVLGGKATQSRVVEGIMTRFATWWNAKDLRPFAKEYIDTARNVAAAFAQAITPLTRATTLTQRQQAFRIAQGHLSPATADEKALADRFQYLVENLLGVRNIDNAESVIARSGTTMTDINKELPVALRFTDKDDYSNGNWMHSWKEWEIKEPAEALYQLTRSLQLATRKNAMLDDAAARWALPVKGGEFSTPVAINRLQGFYFPKQIADQLTEVWRRLETDKFQAGPGILQFLDKVQRMWKTGVTIYSPSHHIRNLNGDIVLAALDGVVSITPYRKSMQVLHAYRGRYKDIESVMNIMDPSLRDTALKSRPGKTVITTKAGHKLTAEQIYEAAEHQGFLLRAADLEDLLGEGGFGTFGPKFAPLGGRLHGFAAGTSELRDHFVRVAHFIDILSKSKVRNLRDAFDIAGRRVKKFHPDGSDLTGFEQNVMRRLIPFYSWLRKSTPLILEGIAMRPHVSVLFPKAMASVQELTGVESLGPGDPFPMDQMFPDWIKEKGVGPLLPEDHPLAGIGRQATWRGETPGYTVINPTSPIVDQIQEILNPKKAVASSVTPFIKLPAELTTGTSSLGIPLESMEGGTAGYLAQQVPPAGIAARVTGMTRPDEEWHPEQLINWLLTGGLVTGTGPYEMQAQYEIRELMQQIASEHRRSMR